MLGTARMCNSNATLLCPYFTGNQQLQKLFYFLDMQSRCRCHICHLAWAVASPCSPARALKLLPSPLAVCNRFCIFPESFWKPDRCHEEVKLIGTCTQSDICMQALHRILIYCCSFPSVSKYIWTLAKPGSVFLISSPFQTTPLWSQHSEVIPDLSFTTESFHPSQQSVFDVG